MTTARDFSYRVTRSYLRIGLSNSRWNGNVGSFDRKNRGQLPKYERHFFNSSKNAILIDSINTVSSSDFFLVIPTLASDLNESCEITIKICCKNSIKTTFVCECFPRSLSLSHSLAAANRAYQRIWNEFPLLNLNVKFSCKLIAKRIDPMIHKQMYFTRATILLIAPPITM